MTATEETRLPPRVLIRVQDMLLIVLFGALIALTWINTPYQFSAHINSAGGIFAFTVEAVFYGHRALWYMIGGGALERHPGL